MGHLGSSSGYRRPSRVHFASQVQPDIKITGTSKAPMYEYMACRSRGNLWRVCDISIGCAWAFDNLKWGVEHIGFGAGFCVGSVSIRRKCAACSGDTQGADYLSDCRHLVFRSLLTIAWVLCAAWSRHEQFVSVYPG